MAAVDEASSQYEYWREARTAQELAAVTHQPGHATASTNPATPRHGPAHWPGPPPATSSGTGRYGCIGLTGHRLLLYCEGMIRVLIFLNFP